MPRLTIFYFLVLGFSSVGSATALEINASLGLAVDSAASLEDLSPNAGSRNSNSDNVTIFEAGIAGEPLSGLSFSYDFSSEEFSDYSDMKFKFQIFLKAEYCFANFDFELFNVILKTTGEVHYTVRNSENGLCTDQKNLEKLELINQE